MLHHSHDPSCPLCDEKKKDAHPDLSDWFDVLKKRHPECHIAWSFRDKENQEQCVKDGKSKLHFPLSAHNKMDDQGNPCALALDLFELDPDGKALFRWPFYKQISDECKANNEPIDWGFEVIGHWDSDHFQLKTKP